MVIPSNKRPLRIGIIAGEASGDQLAAGLIAEICDRYPDAVVEGIAGPLMQAAGCRALFPLEKLSVMGLAEVLRHLPELLRIRRQVVAHFTANPPDVFIGVDAPDFNLGVEARLKRAGIRTVHYVSPSVWAWREKRAQKIGQSADLVLCLFPFEPAIYAKHGVAAEFVGHPMADVISLQTDPDVCRQALGIATDKLTLAVLPGSRISEVSRMGPLFLRTCAQLQQMQSDIQFVAPMATARIRSLFKTQQAQIAPDLPVTLIDGQAREVMGASDAVLLTSGTAALEAMLVKRPMVVAYRVHALTYALVRLLRLLKITRFSLPNILAGREIVPEFMQGRAKAALLAPAVLDCLTNTDSRQQQITTFTQLHEKLRTNTNVVAADAIFRLL